MKRSSSSEPGRATFDPGEINRRAFSYYSRLERVKRYVDSDLSAKISLRTAAARAGLEEKYFSAFFHRKTGVCFSEWLTYRRVEKAKRMLEHHNHSITEVALAVGYEDLTTFERAFKRCTAMTPSDFRAAVRPS